MTHAAAAHSAHDDTHWAPPTSTGLDNQKIAIWAFIGSECMLFASLISTYLIYKGRSVVGPFPHEAWIDPPDCGTPLKAILNIPVTSASTFVLLMSSLAWCSRWPPWRTRTSPKRTTRRADPRLVEAVALDDGDPARRSSASRRSSSRRSCTKG